MKILIAKENIKRFIAFGFLNLLIFAYSIQPSYAKCPDNVVPNPLDPNCEAQPGTLTFGFLINRFIVFLPYIVTLLAIGSYVWGAVKIILAQDEDGKNKGVRILIYTTVGLGAFFSLWLILFIVSIVTGVDLLRAIGQ